MAALPAGGVPAIASSSPAWRPTSIISATEAPVKCVTMRWVKALTFASSRTGVGVVVERSVIGL
jgi:hypothetical protein